MLRRLLPLSVLLSGTVFLAACSSVDSLDAVPATTTQHSTARQGGLAAANSLVANTYVSGKLRSRGGPFLTDSLGRTVYLRGVNAVYKRDPYTLTIDPGMPNSLSEDDARRIATLGFNVVRLGVIWAGIEPGTGGPNQPQICAPGTPTDPKMWNQSVANAYLNQVQRVVNLLGKYHIYSLIDMHQDVYSSVFSGEGAPAWAVCTNGNPVVIYPGRWSDNYSNPAVDASFQNFFFNSVVGNLQGEYDRSWAAVATKFKDNAWVVGYDPINEPLSLQPYKGDQNLLYAQGLSCLYGGSSGATWQLASNATVPCPSSVPKVGLVPLLLNIDKNHLVFPEIDNASDHGKTLFITRAPSYERIVFNFHDYCPQRSGQTGNPTDLVSCSNTELNQLINESQKRPLYATKRQPGGPAIMMTEFGATNNLALAQLLLLDAGTVGLNWAWWSWRYYDDPTGSSSEALISTPDNVYSPVAEALTETRTVAIDGAVLAAQASQSTGMYSLVYVAAGKGPTTIYLSPTAYQQTGYCTYVSGGSVSSKPGSPYLTVQSGKKGETVTVRVVQGSCIAGL